MAVSSLRLGSHPGRLIALKEGYTAFLYFHTF
jgi:hypothetical protein